MAGKGENGSYEHCLPFATMFSRAYFLFFFYLASKIVFVWSVTSTTKSYHVPNFAP